MKNIKLEKELICFDLDGTLIDSSKDIAHCVNLVMNDLGEPTHDEIAIKEAIGRGVKELLMEIMPHRSEEFIRDARERFRVYYRANPYNHTSLYDGAMELTDFLISKGKKLAIVTNKGIETTRVILKHLDIYDKFDIVIGADSLPVKKPSPEPLLYVLNKLNIAKERSVFIGDSLTDAETAKNAEIDFIGANYGFRTKKEVTKDDAILFIDTLCELKDIIT